MKLSRLILFIISSLLLSSCEPNVAEPYNWVSEDGRVKVIIESTQENWAEPWCPRVYIYVNNNLKGEIDALPYFVSEPSEENIEVIWPKDEPGSIIFTQRDGEEKELRLPKIEYY